MKRLLNIIRSANPADGGPIEVVQRVSRALLAHGWDVELASLDAPGAPWLRESPIPIHALGPVGPVGAGYGYTSRLVPWLRSRSAALDLVVVNGLWQYGSFGTWRALRAGRVPYVVFPHGMLDPWFKRHYPLKHAKKWLYWPWAEYRVLRDARAVLFTSEDERVRARESFWLYRCREEVVAFGTARPPDPEAGERERFFGRFPALAGKRLLLFLGRMHEKKGCDLLIHAFASAWRSIPASGDAWHLVMAGPAVTDAYQQHLDRLVDRAGLSGRVTFLGMLTGESKWAAFRAADAFVLPSHQENFGVAVVEALGCGVPVLISDQVNIWRDVLSADAALVESDDQPGTDRLLARWMSLDTAQQTRMRENAATCFASRFDVHEAAAKMSRLLESLQ